MSNTKAWAMIVLAATGMLLPSRLTAEPTDDADLAKVQGVWERKTGEDVPGMHRAIKDIHGTHEIITYYGAGDEVLDAHEVDFKLGIRDGIKIFTFFNWAATAGPNKGHKAPEPISYIYRADENTFVEVWGFLPGQEQRTPRVMMWVRKPTPSAEVREEQQVLQGTWQPDPGEKTAAGVDFPGDELTFNGDDFIVRKGKRVYMKGVVRIEPAHNPRSIDLIITQSPNGLKNGQSIRGIYEVKAGELRVCAGPPNHPRPHEFVVREGSSQNLAVLRREGAPAASPKP